MTFYLQKGIPNNKEGAQEMSREFLDSYLHPECDLLRKVDAESWAEARDTIYA